ncbi:MAG: hypothetical protein OEU32_18565 [Acidimicrobiia bacterium]|nr:hypothetical protein [Acidimicrobiia bacterium]
MRRTIVVGAVTAALVGGGSVGAAIALSDDDAVSVSIAQGEPPEESPIGGFVECLEGQGLDLPDFDGDVAIDIEIRDGDVTLRVDGEEIDLEQAIDDAREAVEACGSEIPVPSELPGLPPLFDERLGDFFGEDFDGGEAKERLEQHLDELFGGVPERGELPHFDELPRFDELFEHLPGPDVGFEPFPPGGFACRLFGEAGWPGDVRERVRERLDTELGLDAEVLDRIDEILADELPGGMFGCDTEPELDN